MMRLYDEIEKVFPVLKELLTHRQFNEFKNTPLGELHNYHFGLGAWVRNTFLYPEDSALSRLFNENGIEHPDRMSAHILSLFHWHINRTL